MAPGVKELLDSVLKGKKVRQFPSDLRSFAMTLHFYLPFGYNYVRESFMNFLPHPSTMREWIKHFNFEPGISKESLATVDRFVRNYNEANPGKKLYFNIVLDEVSIRKHVRWDPVEEILEGFTDIGRGDHAHENGVEVTNALVYMLVCINGYFKIPIAYYLINSLSGKDKSTLLREVLHECHVLGIDVRHITFDGHPSNISMAEQMGAIIYDNTSVAVFNHPDSGHKVHTTLDPCHDLKNIRNAVGTTDIVDAQGNIISFRFIKALVDLQEEEGSHAATQVRKAHINYENDKMKVGLAAQSSSHSVAKALETCEFDHELDAFDGAASIARLSLVVNDCFDFPNSKSKFAAYPWKQAITKENIEELRTKVQGYVNYLKGLRIDDTPVWKSAKRTGFLGFIQGLQNMLGLADDLFAEGSCTYLLTYKLSQDHLEMFFAMIRRFLGLNDNPTVSQFKSAIRKLLCHVDIKVQLGANCRPQHNTTLLMISPVSVADSAERVETAQLTVEPESDLDEISSNFSTFHLSGYLTDVIWYIAGAVVKMLTKKCAVSSALLVYRRAKGRKLHQRYREEKLTENLNQLLKMSS